jgi:hypothetical protein
MKAKNFIKFECQKFKIPIPSIKSLQKIKGELGNVWISKYGRSYSVTTQTIYATGKSKKQYIDQLIHEFSHYIDHRKHTARFKKFKDMFIMKPDPYDPVYHDKTFFNILIEVIKDYYGDTDKYNWEEDYYHFLDYYKEYKEGK